MKKYDRNTASNSEIAEAIISGNMDNLDAVDLETDSFSVKNILTTEDCVGIWRKAPVDGEGFSQLYDLMDNGSFSCQNCSLYSSGQWTLSDNIITLETNPLFNDTAISTEQFSVETAYYYDVPGLLLNGELYLNTDKQYIYYQSINKRIEKTKDFTGKWNRDSEMRAYAAFLDITEQTDRKFNFCIQAYWATHSGVMEDVATIIAPNQAFCYIESYDSADKGLLLFTLIGDDLIIDYDGEIFALGFGHNVTADGIYIQGKPAYENICVTDEYLPTEEIQDRMRALVGDEAYERILFVMEYGFSFIHPASSIQLTYSGFINGAGVGVDFLISDDGNIYCLGYYLDSEGYTFYTNDPEYRDKLPDFMEIFRDNYKLSFVYKDV
jgi:hypothetical protein